MYLKNFSQDQNGFTIVEVLIYLGLFSIIMTGVLVAAYNMFELSDRTQTKTMLTAEGNFLLAKVNWVLSGVSTVNQPVLGSNGSTLSVDKYDTSYGNPLVLDLSGGKLRLKKGSGFAIDLNNDNISISSLTFDHLGTSTATESVTTILILDTKTADGKTLSETFTTTKYLRK